MEGVFEGYKATCDRWDGLVRCASNKGVSRVWGSKVVERDMGIVP